MAAILFGLVTKNAKACTGYSSRPLTVFACLATELKVSVICRLHPSYVCLVQRSAIFSITEPCIIISVRTTFKMIGDKEQRQSQRRTRQNSECYEGWVEFPKPMIWRFLSPPVRYWVAMKYGFASRFCWLIAHLLPARIFFIEPEKKQKVLVLLVAFVRSSAKVSVQMFSLQIW